MPASTTINRLRLFVALGIPEEVKDNIERFQNELRRALSSDALRWTRADQFHLTLRFLGSVEATRLEDLTSALRQVAGGFAPLKLQAQNTGCFPSARSPRVLWVGILDQTNQLLPLQTAVQTATLPWTDEPAEARFKGHVTLARIKGLKASEVDQLARLMLRGSQMSFGLWTADSMELLRSELSASGAKYSVLAKAPFCKPA